MRNDLLHVFGVRSNPIRWRAPDLAARRWIEHMLDSGVRLHLVEVQYGETPFVFADISHVDHIGLRARTWCWSKENALNIGIQRAPDAKYICWSDTDVIHRRSGWAAETVYALQQYDVVQPWSDAYDLGPADEHIQHHVSFCSRFHKGLPVAPAAERFWKFDGGPYDYPHSGYAWAATRQALDWLGGLFELGGMGSGDHHMALALAGKAEYSIPGGVSASYRDEVLRWQARAVQHINGNIGFVPGTIEHLFHGRKADRGYLSRWDIFLRHAFDPTTDLKRNTYGVLEWVGNKPELRREFDLYLRSRNEDINSLV
jgi:hypothetical protein